MPGQPTAVVSLQCNLRKLGQKLIAIDVDLADIEKMQSATEERITLLEQR